MSTPATATRIVLLADHAADAGAREAAKIRRYRLARLRLAESRAREPDRFGHLRRSYD